MLACYLTPIVDPAQSPNFGLGMSVDSSSLSSDKNGLDHLRYVYTCYDYHAQLESCAGADLELVSIGRSIVSIDLHTTR